MSFPIYYSPCILLLNQAISRSEKDAKNDDVAVEAIAKEDHSLDDEIELDAEIQKLKMQMTNVSVAQTVFQTPKEKDLLLKTHC